MTEEAQKTTISEVDKLVLELAKARKQIALVGSEKALAQQEAAEIGYRYVVLQIYMKYGLTDKDTLEENGVIHYDQKK